MQSENVVVIGAGQMGIGIVHAFAAAGYKVAMVDVNAARLDAASRAVGTILAEGVKRGKVTNDAAQSCIARISGHTDLAAAAEGATLVVETATEEVGLKMDLIARASEASAENALIGSNTSALSITELATACREPAHFIGIHFFNPVYKMRLVELVRALQTSDDTLTRARNWAERIGKKSVVVNDSPGFTTSRISAMLGNEAMSMLAEGVASAEDIDASLRMAFNHPMGPLELGDLTGWDTRLKVLEYLHGALGEKFRPNPLLVKMVKSGRYGRKVGHGVYRYRNGEKVPGSGLKVS